MKTKKIATFGAVAALSCGLVGGFTTIPAAFADQSVPQSVSTPTNAGHSYSDGAVISFPSEWKEGQPLNFKGSGFKTADGKSGSVLAIKVNGGGALTKVEADENGNVSGSVPWSEGLKVGDQVEINVLTGSLKEGDVKRGGAAATVEVVGEDNDQKANEQSSSSLPGGGNDNTDQGDKKDESGKGVQGATGDEQKKTEEQGTQTEATKQAADSDSSSQTVTANQSADVNTPAAATNAEAANGAHQFATCDEANEAGFKDIQRNDAAYADHLDSDHDGVACESNGGNGEHGTASNGTGGAGYVSDNNGGSNNASSNSNGKLANTGANGALTVAGLGMVALGVGGATVAALRKRKRA
ncbi:excalibur calcium-binding domain-containing protein [Rothia dentocariosa]|uniref:excalibur calcium-binding domain-containing protein n=1 Tax=Rothia dentocariosa TaxID=2047 RepID=UPI0020403287|nr:excalibur calcium-binding domain-containing protein [Rothia dentocariosa]MCM3437858.1 excalibur calcium-binding domain-containing protein [Rothia dentocariosa]